MKKRKLLLACCFIMAKTYSQIGVNTLTPNASAALDIKSPNNNTGLLIPRLTSVQRTAISSPADGLLVYDTDGKMFYYYDQSISKWLALSPWKSQATVATNTVVVTNNLITNVGINTPVPTQRLEVTGNAKVNGTVMSTSITNTGNVTSATINTQTISVSGFPTNSLLPTGAIIMWSGATIPSGWALCNGSSGTPDLRGRFIVGSGQNYYPNSGDINPIYTIGDMGGENTHHLSSGESGMPAHTPTTQAHNHGIGDYVNNASHACTASGGTTCSFATLYTVPNSTQSATVIVNTVTAQNAALRHENRPPYYALAFIMKL